MFTFGKTLAVASVILALTACSPSYTERTGSYTQLPPELKDCRVYAIQGTGGASPLTVIKCPQADTTTITGKHITSIN